MKSKQFPRLLDGPVSKYEDTPKAATKRAARAQRAALLNPIINSEVAALLRKGATK